MLISLTEAACYLYALRYMFSTEELDMQFIVLFALCVGVTLSFSQKGLLGGSRLFQNKCLGFLGAISLPIYQVQNPVRLLTVNLLSTSRARDGALLTMVMILAIGTLSYLFVKRMKNVIWHGAQR